MSTFSELISKYSVHDDKVIKGFFGPYRFLSNFHMCDVWYEESLYPSSEHAYMAAKSIDPNIRKSLIKIPDEYGKHWGVSAKDARTLGKTIKLRENWEQIKFDIMMNIVFNKFSNNLDIRNKLLQTGDRYLEETCWWRDTFWGVDINLGGQNNLGKILMKVRECLRK